MRLKRMISTVFLSFTLILTMSASAFACTSIYVGSDVSENGNVYVGRSEDYTNNYNKMLGVAPATEHKAGDMFVDCNGFQWPYPSKTYAYTYIKESPKINPDETVFDNDGNPQGEPYAAGCVNEKGVYITATVTTSYNNSAKAADPLVSNGIAEVSIPSVLMANAASAKEAVDLLARIIDEKGSGECYFILIGDGKETWGFDCVAGHQYVATRLPSDQVGFNPNIMLIGEVDVTDTENVVASKELVSLPEEKGFLKKGKSGKIHVASTYSRSFQNTRYWQGAYYMDPEQAEKIDLNQVNADNPLPTMMTPNRKLTALETIRFLGYRGEGTKYDGNVNPRLSSIGNNCHTECHVFETRKGFPLEMTTIEWVTPADAEFGIFLPYYGAMITDVHDAYKVDSVSYVPNSVNWNANVINDLCDKNRANHVGDGIKEYFVKYQASLIEQQAKVDKDMLTIYEYDPALAKKAATDIGKEQAEQYMKVTDSVVEELRAYVAAGDFSKPLKVTMAEKNVMPDYKVPAEYLLTVAQGKLDKANDKINALQKELKQSKDKSAKEIKELKKQLKAAKEEATKANKTLKKIAKQLKVKKLKVKSKPRKATVKFKAVSGVTAYQIQYKQKGKKWADLTKSTTKTKVKSKKLKKGKKYTFRVRTITKVDGKNVYGKWATKKVKIK